jgi:hypothetical protein
MDPLLFEDRVLDREYKLKDYVFLCTVLHSHLLILALFCQEDAK